ncbi:MAG: LysE family transporter [Candidatus Thorarchaeota archaeon]|nr:LysE family transporter [Candidatus Thorarchaeota archaeon]
MGVVEILIIWFVLSLSGALAPGPLSAAVIMQSSRHGRLHGMLPMVGHAIVELGIVATIIVSAQLFAFDSFTTDLLIGLGGIVIVFFGILAAKDYHYKKPETTPEETEGSKVSSVLEATTQGAAVSIFSPYFLIWWAGLGLSSVNVLIGELQVGVGTVFLAGALIYLTHISTDFIFGAFLTVGTDVTTKKADYGGINWVNIVIGLIQIVLGGYFILTALV